MLLKAPRVTMARGRSCRQLGIWSRRYPLVCRADALMKKQRLLAKAKAEIEAEAGDKILGDQPPSRPSIGASPSDAANPIVQC